MKTWKEYLLGSLILISLSIRYYPGHLHRTFLETSRFLGAVILYGLGFAFLFKWALRQFLKKELRWENFFKVALWAAVVMALGESLRHYLRPY